MYEYNKVNLLNGIKSKYILNKILFDYIKKRKSLNIIKFNNNIKERLNINLIGYIECQQIEIEIIPLSMKKRKGKNNYIFINISDKDK